MKACGIEIQGSEAVIALLSLDQGLFEIPECRVRKFILRDDTEQAQIQKFQFDVAKLVEDYKIEKLIIKSRPQKGKFAGGAIGFKIEAALQLIDTVPVEFITSNEIKEQTKRNPVSIDFAVTGLKKFQQGAFESAYASMTAEIYNKD
ncbi:DUF3010 family protein [Motilimonas pumila]|uniref:DUF3010 family protein n=1 Tax=Motilimonas pumila TaxID=2303987 RepID=A0A418YIS1_9GAMM|nr:DUF3010 family protein [Motilimonas pumila]RJG50517.1 DUF3010 family protein [Motilimonas pumila]